MELNGVEGLDKLLIVKKLVRGLYDTMVYMETAEQDKMVPITVLCSFEAVLEKVGLLLEETSLLLEETEDRLNG